MANTTDNREVKGVLFDETDADVKRDRVGRVILFVASAVLAGVIPATFVAFFASYVELRGFTSLGFIVGLVAGELWFAQIAPRFFVVVPQAQAFVTLNNLIAFFGIKRNPNNVFGPGTSLEWPWVTRGEKSNLSLQIITLPVAEKVPGRDTQLIVAGSYQFKVDIRKASRFVGIDESTIRGGMIDMILSEISRELADMFADEAKSKNNIRALNEYLGEKFGVDGRDHRLAAPEVQEFENRYGIASVAVIISGIDVPDDVQKTRDAIDEAAQAVKSVAKMFGMEENELKQMIRDGRISPEQYIEMLDRTLAQGKGATMNIQAHKFGGLDLASIIKALKGGS